MKETLELRVNVMLAPVSKLINFCYIRINIIRQHIVTNAASVF